jgi:hypothetical protein
LYPFTITKKSLYTAVNTINKLKPFTVNKIRFTHSKQYYINSYLPLHPSRVHALYDFFLSQNKSMSRGVTFSLTVMKKTTDSLTDKNAHSLNGLVLV